MMQQWTDYLEELTEVPLWRADLIVTVRDV